LQDQPTRFYAQQECEYWLAGMSRKKPEPEPDLHFEVFEYPKPVCRGCFFGTATVDAE